VSTIASTTSDMLARSVEMAVTGGHGVHVHLQEVREEVTATFQRTGMTSIAFAAGAGLFEAPTIGAHCVWVDHPDREILAEHRVGVAHNPVSNMILASGAAPVAAMRRLGIDVGIGVDGAASNDSQDMLQAIKAASLLARVTQLQATAMSAREVFEMATIGGARALRMEDRIGSIEPGKAADLVVLDGDSPTLANVHDPFQALVYVAGSREVKDVWVDGRRSVADGDVVTVDLADLTARSRPLARRLVTLAGLERLSLLAR
jgi:cytosine/adenosine deaminase-related metal-dependent hydrolase